ncbi:7686_t:CDS:2, partial [Scutellospora calospora]
DKKSPYPLGQFRRAKSTSMIELFKDCKDKENTPPRLSTYASPSYSPLSDQSPLSSPLKRMAESPITQYFKRVDISKTVIKSTAIKSTPIRSGDVVKSTLTRSENDMLISPAPNFMAFKKEKVTISANVSALRHVSKNHVTPPTKSGINGYFHKVRGKHKKVSRYITEDKLHDVSPETLRVFAAARGGDISLFREYAMEN